MKSFILSLCVLSAIIAGVAVSNAHLFFSADELISEAKEISKKNFSDISLRELCEHWNGCKNSFFILSDPKTAREADKDLSDALSALQRKDESSFFTHISSFIYNVEKLREFSSFSLRSII